MSESVFNKAKGLGERSFHTGSSTLGEFKEFILRGNVVSLAVAVVIGTAFNTVIQAFVKDIITPLIPAGSQNFASLTLSIYGGGKLLVGDLLNVIISFLIIAAVVFFLVVKPFNALEAAYEGRKPKHEAAPTTRECPYCLSTVPLQASRCAFCTSPMPPATNAVPQPVI